MLDKRLLMEISLLEKYKGDKDYLKSYKITDFENLKINFCLIVKENEYFFNAIYPHFFPNQAIIIVQETKFYTSHSYKNGSMCLKLGNDNWSSNITLIQLIDNLYELLYLENPLGNEHFKSPSGDEFSIGQQVRYIENEYILIPPQLFSIAPKCGTIELYKKKCYSTKSLIYITKINDIDITNKSCDTKTIKIDYLLIYEDRKELDKINVVEFKNKYEINVLDNYFFFTKDYACFYIDDDKKQINFIDSIISENEIEKRCNIKQDILRNRITIIGLGSIGSRVFLDLARAGFSNFYLIDDDIMFAYNVLRHELTNNSVGEYKVYELRNKVLNEINKNAIIDISILNLLGQESTKAIDDLLNLCSQSEIIIDCTANDRLLLLLDKVSDKNSIPILSGTIIPGGLGNIIIYKKEDCNVSMESILSSFYQWKTQYNIFGKKENDYTTTIDNQPYVATMSDCSILSGLIGKFTIDILKKSNARLSSINVFSTSNYGDLSSYYKTYTINANELPNEDEEYNEELVENGRKIYEDCYKKRSDK